MMSPTPQIKRLAAVVAVVLGLSLVASARCVNPDPPERKPTESDAIAMLRLMNDSERLVTELDKDPTYVRDSVDTPLTADERSRTVGAFATFIDHDLAFMSFRDMFLDAWRVPKDDEVRLYLLALGTGAHAAQLRARLKPISLIGRNDIAPWLGDTRWRGSGKHLIKEADLDVVLPKLRSGDIIVERRNWYLSNLGRPGFSPHAALFLGTPAELVAHFDSDADVIKRLGGPFTAFLKNTGERPDSRRTDGDLAHVAACKEQLG